MNFINSDTTSAVNVRSGNLEGDFPVDNNSNNNNTNNNNNKNSYLHGVAKSTDKSSLHMSSSDSTIKTAAQIMNFHRVYDIDAKVKNNSILYENNINPFSKAQTQLDITDMNDSLKDDIIYKNNASIYKDNNSGMTGDSGSSVSSNSVTAAKKRTWNFSNLFSNWRSDKKDKQYESNDKEFIKPNRISKNNDRNNKANGPLKILSNELEPDNCVSSINPETSTNSITNTNTDSSTSVDKFNRNVSTDNHGTVENNVQRAATFQANSNKIPHLINQKGNSQKNNSIKTSSIAALPTVNSTIVLKDENDDNVSFNINRSVTTSKVNVKLNQVPTTIASTSLSTLLEQSPLKSSSSKTSASSMLRSFNAFEFQRRKRSLDRITFKTEDFDNIKLIGKGAFADVYVCRHIKSNEYVVVKEINRARSIPKANAVSDIPSAVENEIIDNNNSNRNESSFLGEEENVLHLLTQNQCPYITHYYGSFEDKNNVYYVMEYYPGGELYSYIQANPCFAEDHAKFYAAEVVYAIHFMHDHLQLAYRDIKPENILLDKEGHIVLCDFGHAKSLKRGEITHTLCGTPDYSAPELINGKLQLNGHSREVDLWAYGILVYEMLCGITPFHSPNRFELCNNILSRNVEYPTNIMSPNAIDLVSKLIVKDPAQRIGSGERGIVEIMEHPWFSDINWELVRNRSIKAPYIPDVRTTNDSFYYILELSGQNLDQFMFTYHRRSRIKSNANCNRI